MIDRKGRGYTVDEVLDFVDITNTEPPAKDYARDYDGDMMKLGSHRYLCFKKSGVVCVHCDIEGVVFYKERHVGKDKSKTPEIYHFNLYAKRENGKEVLMTKDHIIPKAKGGKNHIDNYQTMCTKCNHKKADMSEEELHEQEKHKCSLCKKPIEDHLKLCIDCSIVDNQIDKIIKQNPQGALKFFRRGLGFLSKQQKAAYKIIKHEIKNNRELVCLSGTVCLKCGKGFYNGVHHPNTAPCTECGDQQQIKMPKEQYDLMVIKRDTRISNENTNQPVT